MDPTDAHHQMEPVKRISTSELSGTLTVEKPMIAGLVGHVTRCLRLLDQYRLEVFWTVLHTFIVWGVFFDQAYGESLCKTMLQFNK